jgi:hypothetical protein
MADMPPMDRSIGAAANLASGKHTPQACCWGDSTLYQPFPEWLSAWHSPWTCRHPAHTGPLETVDTCATCPDWKSAKASNIIVDPSGES